MSVGIWQIGEQGPQRIKASNVELEQHLEDMEDYYLALEVLEKPGRIYTAEEAKGELGL